MSHRPQQRYSQLHPSCMINSTLNPNFQLPIFFQHPQSQLLLDSIARVKLSKLSTTNFSKLETSFFFQHPQCQLLLDSIARVQISKLSTTNFSKLETSSFFQHPQCQLLLDRALPEFR